MPGRQRCFWDVEHGLRELSEQGDSLAKLSATIHQVPCLTLRDDTEWLELVEAGWNRLAPPTDAQQIAHAIFSARVGRRGSAVRPNGHGQASQAIVVALQGSD